jgi:hypothetical protein
MARGGRPDDGVHGDMAESSQACAIGGRAIDGQSGASSSIC